MTDQKKIADKIRALIAKANSTEHEAEAAAFMAKAQELLERHQLDLGDLQDADDPVVINTTGFEQTESSPSWYKDLYVALGALYGCKAVMNPTLIKTSRGNTRWGYSIELTGRESAIVTAQLMFPWVKEQCFAKGRQLFRDRMASLNMPTVKDANEERKQARRVGNALVHRIWGMVRAEQAKNEGPKTEAAKNALVTQDRVLQVYNDHYGELKEGKGRSTTTNMSAREAANSIGLHRQAGHSETLQIGGGK
jgi:hypothetical protein